MFRYLKSKILASIKSKRINIFLLFLLLSFVVLVFLKLSSEFTNTIAFNIEKINVPENYVIIQEDNSQLKLTLRTSGFNFIKYYYGKPKIELDFKRQLFKKDSIYVWSKQQGFSDLKKQLDEDVELISVNPDTLKFRFDINSVKYVPVTSKVRINFEPGYDLKRAITLKPDSIKIIGPEKMVSKISEISTDSIVLNNVMDNINKDITLNIPNKTVNNLKYSHRTVTLNAQVEKFTEGSLKLPVTVINIPEDIEIKYFPRKLNVTFYTSLSNFNSIKAIDFQVVCDFNKVAKGTNFLTPEITEKPEEVRNVKIAKQPIEFIVVK